jgi:hypothetical protein
MVRRIAALLLLDPQLDANYSAVKADPYTWPRAAETGQQVQVEAENLSTAARAYIASLTDQSPDDDHSLGRAIWLHTLATTYSPLYLSENDAGVRSDLPRIPLPTTA